MNGPFAGPDGHKRFDAYVADVQRLLEEYPAPWRLSDPDIHGHHDIYDAAGDMVIIVGIPVLLERGLVAAVNLAAAVRT